MTEMIGPSEEDFLAGLRQGWMICQVLCGDHPPWEVQRVDDAEGVGRDHGVGVPQLDGDEDAVEAMRQAYLRGEEHAVRGHAFLREHSPEEFYLWKMADW